MSTLSEPATEELQKIAQRVMDIYGISPQTISVIQGDSIKTVWKIATRDGALCLKRLKQTMDKARFSVNAQVYIKSSGGKVPGIYLTKDGECIAEYNGQLFVVYEWLEGTDLNFDNPSDLKKAIQGLAEFHRASKGYMPADDCRVSTKSGKWPDQYRSMLNKLGNWKEEAKGKAVRSDYATYLKWADPMIEIGNLSLNALEKSDYGILTEEASASVVLCHQDFGRGNALNTSKGVYVLDLDGVTYDLPARDLRKLIGKRALAANRWEAPYIEEILKWYEEVNPLSPAERKILYIDLLFPHWFFGLVKNLFQAGKPLKPAEIERTARAEESKVQLLKGLMNTEETHEH